MPVHLKQARYSTSLLALQKQAEININPRSYSITSREYNLTVFPIELSPVLKPLASVMDTNNTFVAKSFGKCPEACKHLSFTHWVRTLKKRCLKEG